MRYVRASAVAARRTMTESVPPAAPRDTTSVVSLAVEDEHGAWTERGSRALALCGGIAKNHGLAVGEPHPGI